MVDHVWRSCAGAPVRIPLCTSWCGLPANMQRHALQALKGMGCGACMMLFACGVGCCAGEPSDRLDHFHLLCVAPGQVPGGGRAQPAGAGVALQQLAGRHRLSGQDATIWPGICAHAHSLTKCQCICTGVCARACSSSKLLLMVQPSRAPRRPCLRLLRFQHPGDDCAGGA